MAARPHEPAGDLTQSVRRHWNEQAAHYDRSMDRLEKLLFGDGRRWVCTRATGQTLEIAIGTGRNLGLYDPEVRLTGIDLSSSMLDIARRRAAEQGIEVDLREGDAQALPFSDGEFDSVVSTLSMCSVPDLELTMAEMIRVLRPGGRLVLLDHVRPRSRPLRWLLQGMQSMVNRFMPGSGEQFLRRPLPLVEASGLVIEQQERFKGGAIERLSARKPGG